VSYLQDISFILERGHHLIKLIPSAIILGNRPPEICQIRVLTRTFNCQLIKAINQ
jgi:hypothetical protein